MADNQNDVQGSETSDRTRTSPRLKALEEVRDMLDATLKEWGDDQTVSEDERDTATDTLNAFRAKVEGMITGFTPTSSTGKHYVVLLKDGTRVHMQMVKPPSAKTHSDKFSAAYGPYHRREGANFVVKSGFRPSDEERRIF